MDLGSTSIAVASLGAVACFAGVMALRRALRSRADARALAENVRLERDLPRSLHPVIDPDVCIGSLSCLKSCPEGDILGVVRGAAALVHAEHCVGHGRCAAECPVGAIQLVFGTARRGVDLPEVDERFESSRPGVHVVGELGGMGLIRNAMRQGVECVEGIAEDPERARDGAFDVAIVGAGPAGIAAALAARHAGLSYRLLEQGVLGGSVAHYPRHKVVMTEPVDLPIHGRFGKKRMSKAELLAAFERIVAKARLRVEEGVKVTAVEGADGAFDVVTDGAGRVRARKVILAIGRRGTPRKLAVPGEERPGVTYALADPQQYRGARVLVVGGGDSALEAAGALVEEGGAEVALSHRGAALARCREANRARAERLAAAGRLRVLPGSTVVEIGEREATLATPSGALAVPAEFVVVQIGGELPLALLDRCGVALRRYHGEAPGTRRRGEREGARERMLRATLEREGGRRAFERRLLAALALLGMALLAFLAWKGRHYYPAPAAQRLRLPDHRALRSAGPWGHGVGIAATLFMLSNFLYAARKRFAFMTGWGHIRTWLAFHVFVGFVSPLVIAFHAAFQSRNLLATGTTAALAVVVATGIVGRYIYGLVPAAGGRALEMEELQARVVRLRDEVQPLLAKARHPERLRALFAGVTAPLEQGSLPLLLVTLPLRAVGSRADLLRVRALFPDRAAFAEFREVFLRMRTLRVQIGFYRSLKRLLGGWRVFHASLAMFLVLAIAAHIALSLYLGYGLLR
ncbi:MAG TPA: NAD(P)-binding domain-containing protein [Anaeromyxobacteraceae bacterium]|nr:NAD(P)-binding domain-containing protein [Anaeromyxobacteraceae bacterium]